MKFSAQTTQNFNPVSFYIFVRGVEASLLIGLSLDHAGSVQDLARGKLCFVLRQDTLFSQNLSPTQVHK